MRPLSSVLALLVTALAAGPLAAHAFTLDQHHEPTVNIVHNVGYYSPIGQEFVPAAAHLDVIEVYGSYISGSGPVELQARVRRDAPDGEVLGSSALLTVSPAHAGTLHFDFPDPVATEPGALHVFEVVYVSGTGAIMMGSGDDTHYEPGRAFLSGAFGFPNDFWFRTGLANTVPTAVTSWGAVKSRYR